MIYYNILQSHILYCYNEPKSLNPALALQASLSTGNSAMLVLGRGMEHLQALPSKTGHVRVARGAVHPSSLHTLEVRAFGM